jgi:NitT/TauT family transport system substrate-binding protein
MKKAKYFSVLMAVLLLVGGCVMMGCNSSTSDTSAENAGAAHDSIAYDLRVAVLPTLEALPIYYAQQTGICDSLGFTIEILPYAAQFDCDTALLNNAADVCMMDRTRFAYYIGKGHKLSAQLQIDVKYALVASKDVEAKNVNDLNNRTIAISRHSGAEAFALHAINNAGMKREEVHFPQINDLWLRADMLTNRQVDAAVLPCLQAYWAALNGHQILKGDAIIPEAAMQLVYCSNTKNSPKIALLIKAYELAKADIENKSLHSCRNILIKDYKISAAHTDSILKKLP